MYKNVEVTAQYDAIFIPYIVFGGSCYEWLNYQEPKENRMLDLLIDQTGDVDLILFMPKIDFTDKTLEGDASHYYYKDGRPNKLLQSLLDWITSQLIVIFQDIHIENLVESTPVLSNFGDVELHSVSLNMNKIFITQVAVKDPQSTKLQVTCKFNGMTDPDHILEFVLNCGSDLPKDQNSINMRMSQKLSQVINGLRMENFDRLYEGNKDSLSTRTRSLPDSRIHKYYNHIQRLKYLNMYQSHNFDVLLIPEYLCLLIMLKKDDGWDVFAIKEEPEYVTKSQLYGNLLQKLNDELKNPQIQKKLEYSFKFILTGYAELRKSILKYFLTNNITSLGDLILHFNKVYNVSRPAPLRRHKLNRCAISGGNYEFII